MEEVKEEDGVEKQKLYLNRVKEWVDKWKNRWKRAGTEQEVGDIYYEEKNFTAAKISYKRAVKLDSQNIAHYDNLGLTLTALNEYEKAIKYFKIGLKQYASQNDFYIFYNCGRTLNIMKRFNEAIPHFQTAIKIDPLYVYGYIALGNSYSGLRRYEEAIESAKKAIEVNPNIPSSYYLIGNCYIKMGNVDEGIGYLKREIEVAPNRAAGYYNLANVLDDVKRYDEAIYYFKKAIEVDPNYGSSYNNLGFTYRNIRDYDNAIEQFKEVTKREPFATDGYYNLSETFYNVGRYKEALEQAEMGDKLLKIRKTNTLVHSCTALPLIKLKEYEKAKIDIQSCFSIPEDTFDLFCYGLVLYKLKEYQNSSLNLLNCIIIGPVLEYTSKTKYYFAMTLIKLKENNCDKIIDNFNDSIEAEPNWSKPYYRLAQFLNLKFPIEKKEEIKSNYLFAVEKNNLMPPCDRLSELKIIKILETVSLL